MHPAVRIPQAAQLAPATKRILRHTGAELVSVGNAEECKLVRRRSSASWQLTILVEVQDGATGIPSLKRLQEATEALDDPPWSVDKDWLSADRRSDFLKLVDELREQVRGFTEISVIQPYI